MLTWRRSLTRNDWKRHGSITNGHHGRPSALAGGVVGAGTTMSVDYEAVGESSRFSTYFRPRFFRQQREASGGPGGRQ